MRQVISVLYELAEQGGGVTRVSLARTAALADAGLMARIAVLDFDEKLDQTFANLVRQSRVSKDLEVLHFYRWFAHRANCLMMGVVDFNQSTVEHLNVLVRKRVEHVNGFQLGVNRYVTSTGFVFMEEFFQNKNDVVMVILFIPGERPLKFNSLVSVHAYWLKCLSLGCLPSFLLADSIGAADTICRVEGRGIYRILMMHSNHLLKPHNVGAPIAPKYDGVIRGIERCDRLVVLTQGQLRDVCERFPAGRYTVIGNLVTIDPATAQVSRDENLAVVVSRLHGVKRIKTMVKAFSRVIARNPNARLEIWGAGEQEDDIKEFIIGLGMQDSIKLMGFATDVSEVFRRASVSLGMSVTEGFGISFAESLGYGTPLVSTRTNYGPQEIVTDGEDGFIVDSEDEFVDKVALLLSDKCLVSDMGEKGRESAKRFASGAITRLWLSLFDDLTSSPTGRLECWVPDGRILENVVSSKVGWIYLPKVADVEGAGSYLSARSAFVVEVSDKREFLGKVVRLPLGFYEVDGMVLDEEKGRYRFRLMKDGVPFRGVIASKALKFVLD
ncbi:glycosyltransferase [Pseudomonas sp. IT-P218]|jgi:glycosyltransferase involved in cell wall biosynthesis|uniref:glycosyltransferase n=1 Tax=Pseudomonas sp. IT-P218 TaxID=3026449 RepID=UPI0039E15CA9